MKMGVGFPSDQIFPKVSNENLTQKDTFRKLAILEKRNENFEITENILMNKRSAN